MRILLTNDDGVEQEGLVALAQTMLDRGHEVTIIGPASERSGSGSSVGSIEHGAVVALRRVELPTRPAITAIALDAPPSLAVLAATSGQFGTLPDLIVSGVNPGHNVGRSVLFSGTLGAVLTGSIADLPGIAVSCGFEPEARSDTAAEIAGRIVDWFVAAGMPRLSVNVNVPDVDLDRVTEVREGFLGLRSRFSLRMVEGEGELVLTREPTDRAPEPGSDLAAILDGAVSVTVLRPLNSVADDAVRSMTDRILSGAAAAIETSV